MVKAMTDDCARASRQCLLTSNMLTAVKHVPDSLLPHVPTWGLSDYLHVLRTQEQGNYVIM